MEDPGGMVVVLGWWCLRLAAHGATTFPFFIDVGWRVDEFIRFDIDKLIFMVSGLLHIIA